MKDYEASVFRFLIVSFSYRVSKSLYMVWKSAQITAGIFLTFFVWVGLPLVALVVASALLTLLLSLVGLTIFADFDLQVLLNQYVTICWAFSIVMSLVGVSFYADEHAKEFREHFPPRKKLKQQEESESTE